MKDSDSQRRAAFDLEWEFLREPVSVAIREGDEGWPAGARFMRLERDDAYGLKAVVEGVAGRETEAMLSDNKWLDWFHASVAGLRYGYAFPEIRLLGSWTYHGSLVAGFPDRFEAPAYVHQVRRDLRASSSRTEWHAEWYINGPARPEVWHRRTVRKLSRGFRRERVGLELLTLEVPCGELGFRSSWDHFLISAGQVRCIVASVPGGPCPDWARGYGIEFRSTWGIPDEDQRDAMSEAVGFLFGRQPLLVGSSTYSHEGWPLECIARPAWGKWVQDSCAMGEHSPFQLPQVNGATGYEELERGTNPLISSYLKLRDQLRLGDALWRYWTSCIVPLDAMLPTIAAALEVVVSAWYKLNERTGNTKYMDAKAFREMLSPELKVINQKLGDIEFGDRMFNRIDSAFSVGANQRIPFFLGRIGLPIGQREHRALDDRSASVHGSSRQTENGTWQLVDSVKAYQCLFRRVMLRLLEHQGCYTDRTDSEQPERSILEPLGGLAADPVFQRLG